MTFRYLRDLLDMHHIYSPPVLVSAGGAISNMYSVMIARYKYFPEVKTKGMAAAPRLVLFTSEHVSPSLYYWLLSSDHLNTFYIQVYQLISVHWVWIHLILNWIVTVPAEPLLHQESQCSSGFWHREPHSSEDRWKVCSILNPHAHCLVKDQICRWLTTVFFFLQRESHPCWFGSQSNRGQTKGEHKQQWLIYLLLIVIPHTKRHSSDPWSLLVANGALVCARAARLFQWG